MENYQSQLQKPLHLQKPYLLPESIPHLPPPPQSSSEELQEVQKKQIQAKQDATLSILIKNFDVSFVDDFLQLLPKDSGRLFRPLLQTLHHDCDILIMREKLRHGRLRPAPWAKKHRISFRPYGISTHKTPSYPSFHAATSKIMALALSEIFPHRESLLHDLAHSIAQSRLHAGVHFPSDIEAGIQWAENTWRVAKESGLRVQKSFTPKDQL